MGWSLQPSQGTVSLLALVELAAVAGCPKIKGLAAVTQEGSQELAVGWRRLLQERKTLHFQH